jgi:Zn ribbon nucleic-acid-binding protein
MAVRLPWCGIRCPQCNGQMLMNNVEMYYAFECLQCGEHRFVPQRLLTKPAAAPRASQSTAQPSLPRPAVLPAVAAPPGDASRIA